MKYIKSLLVIAVALGFILLATALKGYNSSPGCSPGEQNYHFHGSEGCCHSLVHGVCS